MLIKGVFLCFSWKINSKKIEKRKERKSLKIQEGNFKVQDILNSTQVNLLQFNGFYEISTKTGNCSAFKRDRLLICYAWIFHHQIFFGVILVLDFTSRVAKNRKRRINIGILKREKNVLQFYQIRKFIYCQRCRALCKN